MTHDVAVDDLDAQIDALFAGPPAEFTAARDALARRLRADGARGDADAVRALRRPSKLAAALNAVSREDPDRMRALVAAQDALAAAQDRVLSGAGDADGLRAAEAAEAQALAAFPGDPELRAALRTAARTATLREDLVRGRLARDPEPDAGGTGLFALGPAVARTAAPPADELAQARRARASREAAAEPAGDPAAREAHAARVREAIAALEAARADQEAASAARDAALRAAEEAVRDRGRLAAEREALRSRLEAASEAVSAGERAAREAERARGAAEAALVAATRARDGAERAARRLAQEAPGSD